MPDSLLLESSLVDGYLLEDGSGILLLEPPRPYYDAVRADGPAAYWRLGETSGTVAVDSIGGNNGTYTGTYIQGGSGALSGDTDTSVAFAGTGYVNVPDANSLDYGDGPLSVEFWLKQSSTGGGYLVVKGSQFVIRMFAQKVGVDDDNNPKYAEEATALDFVTNGAIWYHYVVTHTTGATKIYRNGVDVTVILTSEKVLSSNATALTIGSYTGGTAPFAGSLDEVAVYPVVLTLAQVQHHYYAGLASGYRATVLADSPVAYWRLNEQSGTTVARDPVGNHDMQYVGLHPTHFILGQPPVLPSGDPDTSIFFDGIGLGEGGTAVNGSIIGALTNSSMEAWVNLNGNLTNDHPIYDESASSGNPQWGLWFVYDGVSKNIILFKHKDTAGTYEEVYDSSTSLSGAVHHVCVTKAGTAILLYVDGVQVKSTALTGTDTMTGTIVPRIGAAAQTSSVWTGYLDEVAVYNTTLTAAQVLHHYYAGLASAYRAAILADAPVSYWRLGEPSGTVAVDQMQRNDGTYVASPTLGVTGAPSGDVDTAATFNGTTQYVSVPDSVSLHLGNGPMSYEVWYKWGGAAGNKYLFGHGAGTAALYVNPTGNVVAHNYAVQTLSQSSVALDTTNWHHIVFTKDATDTNGSSLSWKIYIDGVDRTTQVNTTYGLTDDSSVAAGFFIGWDNGAGAQANGPMDEAALYNVTLTPTQIAAHFVAGGGTIAGQGVAFPFFGGGYYP